MSFYKNKTFQCNCVWACLWQTVRFRWYYHGLMWASFFTARLLYLYHFFGRAELALTAQSLRPLARADIIKRAVASRHGQRDAAPLLGRISSKEQLLLDTGSVTLHPCSGGYNQKSSCSSTRGITS